MSDARSQQRTGWRQRQRTIRRGMGADLRTPPWRQLGDANQKYRRLRAWLARLAREHLEGTLCKGSRILARDLKLAAAADWLLGLIWSWRRGPDNQYDVTPGRSGLTLAHLEQTHGKWNICRTLRNRLVNKSYEPEPLRRIWIPKQHSNDKRPIDVAEAWDWLVEKAVQLTTTDLLTLWLPDACIAYRKGLGHLHALARVFDLAESLNLHRWLIADISNAYTNVPHARLKDVLQLKIPCPDIVGLIMKLMDPARRVDANVKQRRGIPQGSPLSPMLFNAYCAHFIDLPWGKRFPQWPLLRYADDILILTTCKRDAQHAHRELARLLISAGFTIKAKKTRNVCMRNSTIQWLGHTITQTDTGQYTVGVPPGSWTHLLESLQQHVLRDDPVSVHDAICGFLRYHAPAWPSQDASLAARQVRTALVEAGIDLPEPIEGGWSWEDSWVSAAKSGIRDWQRILRQQTLKAELRERS